MKRPRMNLLYLCKYWFGSATLKRNIGPGDCKPSDITRIWCLLNFGGPAKCRRSRVRVGVHHFISSSAPSHHIRSPAHWIPTFPSRSLLFIHYSLFAPHFRMPATSNRNVRRLRHELEHWKHREQPSPQRPKTNGQTRVDVRCIAGVLNIARVQGSGRLAVGARRGWFSASVRSANAGGANKCTPAKRD